MDETTDSGILPNVNSYIVRPIDYSYINLALFIIVTIFLIKKFVK